MKQEVTRDVMEQMETRWQKEAEERREIDNSMRKAYEEQKEKGDNDEIRKAWKSVRMLPKKLLGKGEHH